MLFRAALFAVRNLLHYGWRFLAALGMTVGLHPSREPEETTTRKPMKS